MTVQEFWIKKLTPVNGEVPILLEINACVEGLMTQFRYSLKLAVEVSIACQVAMATSDGLNEKEIELLQDLLNTHYAEVLKG